MPPVVTAPTETVEDDEVPLANVGLTDGDEDLGEEISVEDEAVPLANGIGGSWALVNFALMNLAVFESLMLLIGYFVQTKKKSGDEEEKETKLKKKGIVRAISLPIALISIIAFCLTEDISLPTAFVDNYTILMAIIAIAQTFVVALSRKKEEDAGEEEVAVEARA